MPLVLARITRRFNKSSGNVELVGYEDVPDAISIGWALTFPDGHKATVREIVYTILPRGFGGAPPVCFDIHMHSEPGDHYTEVVGLGHYSPVETP